MASIDTSMQRAASELRSECRLALDHHIARAQLFRSDMNRFDEASVLPLNWRCQALELTKDACAVINCLEDGDCCAVVVPRSGQSVEWLPRLVCDLVENAARHELPEVFFEKMDLLTGAIHSILEDSAV